MRTRIERASRLARGIQNLETRKSLEAYAEELETELQKLEAQAAVTQQADARDAAQEAAPGPSMAALKPSSDSKPEI